MSAFFARERAVRMEQENASGISAAVLFRNYDIFEF
jgi:hypothetical protein